MYLAMRLITPITLPLLESVQILTQQIAPPILLVSLVPATTFLSPLLLLRLLLIITSH